MALIYIWNCFWSLMIVLGTAYIVFVLGYSGWWWALAICLLMGGEIKINGQREEKQSAQKAHR